jgi:uncharacterized membrane protein YgdD (TMEM256/DUF423 family)
MALSQDHSRGALSGAPFLILAWAGIAGAAGVALAAVAAHKVDSPALATAATMLTLHAAAAVGVVAISARTTRARLWTAVAGLMLLGATLFCGEIAFHTFTANAALQALAPVGGTIMIASWALLAIAALLSVRRG